MCIYNIYVRVRPTRIYTVNETVQTHVLLTTFGILVNELYLSDSGNVYLG